MTWKFNSNYERPANPQNNETVKTLPNEVVSLDTWDISCI
jgi:hypothetical protein